MKETKIFKGQLELWTFGIVLATFVVALVAWIQLAELRKTSGADFMGRRKLSKRNIFLQPNNRRILQNKKGSVTKMKNSIFLTIILCLLIVTSGAFAQIDDVLKKIKKIPGVPDWTPGGAVTTTIKDAYPVVTWLKEFDDGREPSEVTDFNLGPGYYRTQIQTYCLHAGAYGNYAPTQGSGYLIAPLLGNQAGLISNILERSEAHPEIEQHDIQELIWGIEAGAKFSDYPPDYQARVKPLLTMEEIAKMNIDLSEAFNQVPDELKDAANMYNDLRKRLIDPSSNYQDIENIAVKNGIPPIGPGSKTIEPGNWAYMKDGFFVRTFPISYPKTIIEIYRPAAVQVTRDEKNRITAFENEGYRMEISYDDGAGMDVLSTSGNPDVPIWRIKSIVLHGPGAGEELTLDNYPGWIVKDHGVGKNLTPSSVHLPTDPTYAEYQARVESMKQAHKEFEKYKEERQKIKGGGTADCDKGDFDDNKMIHDGLKAATNPEDLKGKGKWIGKNLQNTTDWWNQSSNALAGGTGDCNNNPKKFNPTKHTSTPGNTNAQRLGMSNRH